MTTPKKNRMKVTITKNFKHKKHHKTIVIHIYPLNPSICKLSKDLRGALYCKLIPY